MVLRPRPARPGHRPWRAWMREHHPSADPCMSIIPVPLDQREPTTKPPRSIGGSRPPLLQVRAPPPCSSAARGLGIDNGRRSMRGATRPRSPDHRSLMSLLEAARPAPADHQATPITPQLLQVRAPRPPSAPRSLSCRQWVVVDARRPPRSASCRSPMPLDQLEPTEPPPPSCRKHGAAD